MCCPIPIVLSHFWAFPQQTAKVRYILISDNIFLFTSQLYICSHSDMCPAQIVRLVRYPATPAPSSESTTVIAECADNARRVSSSLSVTCSSDGSWSGSPQCQCNDEYQTATIDGRQVCIG